MEDLVSWETNVFHNQHSFGVLLKWGVRPLWTFLELQVQLPNSLRSRVELMFLLGAVMFEGEYTGCDSALFAVC